MKRKSKPRSISLKVNKPKKGTLKDLRNRSLLYTPKTKLHVVDCCNCVYLKSEKYTSYISGCWDCFYTGKDLAEKLPCVNCLGSGKYNKKALEITKEEKLLESIFGKLEDKEKKFIDKTKCYTCKGKGYYEALVSQHDDKKETVKCSECNGKGFKHQMTDDEERDYVGH